MKQLKISLCNPRLDKKEAKAVYEVVLSGWINEGKKVGELEENFAQYIGVKHAIATFNGTVALHLILLAHNIGKGDEVIVPSLTFVSTVTSVLHVGAKPVFADIDPTTYNIDPNDIKYKITSKTKAIIPVHYGGQSADMDSILSVAEKHNLYVFEDAAEAHGATYKGKKVGTFGNANMFSFTPTKNITTAEGGMVTTNNEKIKEKIRLLKNHGQDYQYHHILVGYNYRMTEMQAAMGIEQLKKLENIIEIKRKNAQYFGKIISTIPFLTPPYEAPCAKHTYMLYTVRLDSKKFKITRDLLIEKLRKKGIESKVCFPPAHLQPILSKFRIRLPVTEKITKEIFSLPFHSKLKKKDFEYIGDVLKYIIR